MYYYVFYIDLDIQKHLPSNKNVWMKDTMTICFGELLYKEEQSSRSCVIVLSLIGIEINITNTNAVIK